MSFINCINNLLLLENLLGIYRNFSSQKKIKKYLIVVLICVQTFLHTIILIGDELYLIGGNDFNQIRLINGGFSGLSYANSMVFVITGICYSRAFNSYYKSISHVSEWFKDEKKLINSLKKSYWCGIVFTSFCFGCTFYRAVDIYFILLHSYPCYFIPVLVSQTILRNIIIFEHFALFFIILVVVNLLRSLTSLISTVQKRVGSCVISLDEPCDITKEQIQEWLDLYRHLSNCCEKVTIFGGRQYFLSVILSLSHYILMSYQYIYVESLDIGRISECMKMMIVSILSYISAMMLPLVAGQIAKNQGGKLHRVLIRLYNTIICTSDAKSIKDFIRLMKKNPIEIKLLSKMPAGMYMLPVILSLAVNYLIVILQFNHII